jgi:glucose-1-phosphate cytidylyltransferase
MKYYAHYGHKDFHMITLDEAGIVKSIEHITQYRARINGGFFLFRTRGFPIHQGGGELVKKPFRRLISKRATLILRT